MNHSSKGFTLIELLMVIIIIGTLGTSAVGSFLDFRKEARAAVVQRALSTIRSAFKNQEMQARLRCNVTSTDLTLVPQFNRYENKMNVGLVWASNFNDITYFLPGDFRHLCTTAQISSPAERKFWDKTIGVEQARAYVNGIDAGGVDYPINVLNVQTGSLTICSVWGDDFLGDYGITDRCAAADHIHSRGYHCNWLYNVPTGEIWPGSNTPGINECYF